MLRLGSILILFLWTVTGTLPVAATAVGPDATATLTGVVLGPTGLPLADIQVRATSRRTGVDLAVGTDAAGRFRLARLLPGIDYVLRLQDRDGRLRPAVQDRIVLTAGDVRQEAFRLDYSIDAWLALRGGGRPPVVSMTEIGQRVVFDHIFIEGLPILR